VAGADAAHFARVGAKLPTALSVWSRRRFQHIGSAGHLDAGVSRSASLLAASFWRRGYRSRTNDRKSRPAPPWGRGPANFRTQFVRANVPEVIAPGRTCLRSGRDAASDRRVDRHARLPVPSGLLPLGHVPKVRPCRRAGYARDAGVCLCAFRQAARPLRRIAS